MSEKLKPYPVNIKLPIIWGHMDAFEHVNNIMFFRFFESARIAYFEEVGFLEAMKQTGVGPILASTSCTYVTPLTYPDTIHVGAKTISLEEDRFNMKYLIVSTKNNTVAATGDAKVVSYNYNINEKVLLPDKVRKNIVKLEKDLS